MRFSLPTTRVCRLVLLLFSATWLGSCSSPRNTALAITHANVIDVIGGQVLPDSTVLISGSRVSAVGTFSTVRIPTDARIVDATGKFLTPGLADMHLHLTGAGEPTGSRDFFLPLLVANGITTVRDMGGKVELLKGLRDEINSGKRLGPQIFFTGPYLDGDPPAFQPSIVVARASDAAASVRNLKSEGVDFIKVQSRLSRDAFLAIADECRAQHIRFVGHVPDTVSASEASQAGQTTIEHLTGVLLGTSSKEDELRREQLAPRPPNESPEVARARGRAWQRKLLESSPHKADALISEFVTNDTWQVPTFPVLVHMGFLTPGTDLRGDPRSKYLSSGLRQIWEQGRNERLQHYAAEDFALRSAIIQRSLEIVGKMNNAGVPIMAGTDAAAPNVYPGFSLHEDLEFLVQAGLSPLQALQAATLKPAQLQGRESEQGTIAVGQRADLVLLDANPLDNIRNTQQIRVVVLNGKLLERRDLDALLESAARSAATH